MKHNLRDVSIIIPVRIDTEARLENLKTVLRYFETFYEGYEIQLTESAPAPLCGGLADGKVVWYTFEECRSEKFHRTRLLNEAAVRTERGIISAYDADVILEREAIAETVRILRAGEASFVLPYSGVCLDIGAGTKKAFLGNFDFELIRLPQGVKAEIGCAYGADVVCTHVEAVGGAPFFDRRKFLRYGGYNWKMMSYGFEDPEIAGRFLILGGSVQKLKKWNLYHLYHPRGVNSSINNPYYERNRIERDKVLAMSKEQLVDYVRNELKEGR